MCVKISVNFLQIHQQHSHLLESNVLGVLSEALTAEVQSILSNDSVIVGAGSAKMIETAII